MTTALAILHDAGVFDAARAGLERRAGRPNTDCLNPGVLRLWAKEILEPINTPRVTAYHTGASEALIGLATLIEAGALELRRPEKGIL